MRVVFEERPSMDTVFVYLLSDGEKGSRFAHLSNGSVCEVAPNLEAPCFLRLDPQMMRAFEQAFAERNGPARAERDTLAADVEDARGTRDRLLALVERMAT